jgi:hypothetical protein
MIRVGMKIMSTHFSASAEVKSIDGDLVVLLLTPSDGISYTQTFPLQHVKDCLTNGSFWEPKREAPQFGII